MHPLYEAEKSPATPAAWSADAAFIWLPDGGAYYEPPTNGYCRFRRTFSAPADARSASIRIFADTRYALWLNGRPVGRGPCRADPRYAYYDEHDLSPHLQPGRQNVLAALVVHYGYSTGQSVSRLPCLLADVTVGGSLRIGTDATWKCSIDAAFDPDAPRMNGCQGQIEVCDHRAAETGWQSIGFDDSAWPAPRVRAFGRHTHPFWNLLPRPIPHLREGFVDAKKEVRHATVESRPEPVERIHWQLIREQSGAWRDQPIARAGDGSVRIGAAPAGRANVLTFDLGRIEVGYARLDIEGRDGTVVDLAYAESLPDGKVPVHWVSNRPFARFILREGRNELEIAFAWRAFRFLRLTIRNDAGPVIVRRVGVRTRHYPLADRGRFECADARTNDIWAISRRTVALCAQDALVDSPSREQQQWMGDGRWQAIYVHLLSGDPRPHGKLLDQIGQGQDCHGLTRSRYPDGHENYQPIPGFTLAWVGSFADYHLYTGDLSPARRWWPNLLLAMRWFSQFVGDDGLLHDVPHWNFTDQGETTTGPWVDAERGGATAPLNLHYLEALRAVASLANSLGDDAAAAHFASRALTVAPAISTHLWDESAGAFADCRVRGELSASTSEVSNALALLHLLDPGDSRSPTIIKRIFRDPSPARRVVKASPYMMLVVCRGLAKHGAAALALEIVRRRYGALLDAGATSLWERWELTSHAKRDEELENTSASHAWGAAPVVFYAESILGIRPLAPGFRRFECRPDPLSLDHASGRVPTPQGDIEVTLKHSGARVEVELLVPEGCEAITTDPASPLTAGRHRFTL